MKRLVIMTGCLCVVFSHAAVADPKPGKEKASITLAQGGPPGHAKKAGNLPPGLAKKPYGLPPGQAKKIWQRGQRIPLTYINPQYVIVQPQSYRLPAAAPGYKWVLVGDDAYLVRNDDGLISNVVANAIAKLIR